ncbi:MAG TPA: YfiR family protein [Steroidobacteraceae bacterium]|jgi:hypothetical protein|nr:YfiR family protein [Steroidobacteraceae bacterium]
MACPRRFLGALKAGCRVGLVAAALLSAVLCVTGSAAAAVGSAPTEYQVKAVFVYNFSRFVAWPASAFASANQPFVIGILGDDPFGSHLDEAVQGEHVDSHPLVVRRFTDVDHIGDCQILFIDRSAAAHLDLILAKLDHHSTLTVTDAQDASLHGVMIQFETLDQRIRLRINADSARAAGLTISAPLLQLAQIVRTED